MKETLKNLLALLSVYKIDVMLVKDTDGEILEGVITHHDQSFRLNLLNIKPGSDETALMHTIVAAILVSLK